MVETYTFINKVDVLFGVHVLNHAVLISYLSLLATLHGFQFSGFFHQVRVLGSILFGQVRRTDFRPPNAQRLLAVWFASPQRWPVNVYFLGWNPDVDTRCLCLIIWRHLCVWCAWRWRTLKFNLRPVCWQLNCGSLTFNSRRYSAYIDVFDFLNIFRVGFNIFVDNW